VVIAADAMSQNSLAGNSVRQLGVILAAFALSDEMVKSQRARGRGAVVAKLVGQKSKLQTLFQEGCGKIRLPETFSNEMEAVLINSSGGLTGGDVLEWRAEAGDGCSLSVTTQACEKIYKAAQGTADVGVKLKIGKQAKLHWLPQESILFDRASLSRKLDVEMEEGAELIAIESVLLGRQAMGEAMNEGLLHDRWRILQNGKLIHAEDLRLSGQVAELSERKAVLSGHVAFATVLYIGPLTEVLLPKLRAIVGDAGGVSEWQGKLIIRLSAPDGFSMRKIIFPVLQQLRLGAAVPKVWKL
jgi:urease accessory protein